MKIKKKCSQIFLLFLMIQMFSVQGQTMLPVSTYYISDITHSSTRAEVIDWRYKVVDGKMYKRLYNYTIGKWIGDWILV